MFRSAFLLAAFVALYTCYAAPSANADASAVIPGVADIASNAAAALPEVMGTVGNVANTASGAVNNLAGAAGGIAGEIPIAGPLVQQLLGTVLGLLGVVLGIAHQLPMPAASGSIQASARFHSCRNKYCKYPPSVSNRVVGPTGQRLRVTVEAAL
ncbi:hypothetical protein ANCCAN_01579 [Ancylostoma caninum]|uniref:Uncharacterized protein n=1 Tax=Ancylostoma caninum TaxID=29170 RepID=A0A368H953_ANCCA|nr:hypothetical protein ANCCAN_01579 [Ancylostoma caninum]